MRLKQAEKLKVVIDSNIIISAPLSEDGNPAKIFELILLEEISNFTSREIIREVTEVFKRGKIKRRVPEDKTNFIIKNFKKFSKLIKPDVVLSIIKDDVDDNRVLECAETANADYIVSGDEHLLKLKNYKYVKLVTPKEFFGAYLKN